MLVCLDGHEVRDRDELERCCCWQKGDFVSNLTRPVGELSISPWSNGVWFCTMSSWLSAYQDLSKVCIVLLSLIFKCAFNFKSTFGMVASPVTSDQCLAVTHWIDIIRLCPNMFNVKTFFPDNKIFNLKMRQCETVLSLQWKYLEIQIKIVIV